MGSPNSSRKNDQKKQSATESCQKIVTTINN